MPESMKRNYHATKMLCNRPFSTCIRLRQSKPILHTEEELTGGFRRIYN